MKLLILIAAIAAVKAASVSNSCTVTPWGEWQEKHTHEDHSQKSFAVDLEVSRKAVREQTMKLKDELREYRTTCRADGSCPELALKKSEGFIRCVNGFIDSPNNENDVLCSNVDQESFMDFDDLLSGGASGNDCWGWTSSTGTEIAIMGLTTGTTFVDVTDPNNPVAIAFMPSNGASSTWRDMKVVNDYAFIVSEAFGHGIQSFDLSRLATITPGSTVSADQIIGDNILGSCHNIISNPATNKIIGVGCTGGNHCADGGGLYIVDVSDPANPTLPSGSVNCYDGDGYTHDAQCVVYNGPDTAHVGKDICFAYNENTLTIVDIEDENGITMLSRTGYLGSAYTHQGWITEDHTVVLLDDEQDEQGGSGELRTYIWDVSDLDNPVLETTHMHGIQSIDHNQYIKGDLTYQANYMSGLRILQIDNANFAINEVGYFDVFPTSDNDLFFGAWSVYPYFPSGNIIISSIDFGMFVVSHGDIASPKDNMIERTRYRTIMNAGNGECPTLVQRELHHVDK